MEDIESATFQRDFEDAIDRVGTTLYSEEYLDLRGLADFRYVCFVDFDEKGLVTASGVLADYPEVVSELQDPGTDTNIFLLTDKVEEKFSNRKIEIINDQNFVCAQVGAGGSINLFLRGLGRSVELGLSN